VTITYSVEQVPIERIRAFDFQPRKWFDAEEISARAASMKLIGQQDPVTVERICNDLNHDFELINGESRLRSAKEAGIATLWVAIRSEPFGSKIDKHLASLVANFNRSEHTALEICDALCIQMAEGKLNQTELAKVLGKSQSWVAQHVSLTKLHPRAKQLMHPSRAPKDRLSMSAAVELARLPHAEQLEVIRLSHGAIHRMKLRVAAKAHVEVAQPCALPWTSERMKKRQVYRDTKLEHVEKLRAGIAEFRALLNRKIYG
jgi:ParB/RepB/Spo0J family partition protein